MGIPHLGGHLRAQDLSPGTDGGVAPVESLCKMGIQPGKNGDLTWFKSKKV